MSTTTSSSLSIDEEEVNFIKYFIALKHGRAAMVRVFEWGYQGGHPIKDYLLTRPGYNDQKFESDFNPDQRRKLSSSTPVDVESYDISLLYALLQMACGLAQSRNPIWNTYGQTLENHLYRLKQLRNNVIHEEQRLTEQSLDTKLFELQDLIEHTYQHAASSFGKSCQVVSQLCSELCQKFAGIKAKIREPLQPADLIQLQQLQQELQIFGDHIKCKIKHMGAQELYDQYQKLYMIDPVPWLRLGINYRPSIAFTELTIQEDEVMCDHSSQGKQARYVRCENIWQETVNNGTTPDIIILTGEAGSGKTFLLKYLIEKWSCDANAVHGLDQVDIVLYTHCEQSVICSLDQLIKQLFHNTLQESCVDIDFFRVTLLKLKTIILIDGYDKANSDSEVFLKNVLQAGGNVRVLVATHPKSKDYISQLLTSANHPLHLTLKGFTPELHSQYTDKMIDILVEDINQRASIKECISSKLKELEITLGDECNDPLTLTLLSLLWVECPQTVNTHTSMTDLSQEITNLKVKPLMND